MLSFNQAARNNNSSSYEGYASDGSSTDSAQVAIYNEDDLSHFLYADHTILSSSQGGSGNIIINAVERDVPIATPHLSDNESAILSDFEGESDYEIPPSPSRRRGGTMSVSDSEFEWPVFLGRQEEPMTPELPVAGLALPVAATKQPPMAMVSPNCVCAQCTASRNGQMVPHNQVGEIEGPMMSWWPAPIEDMEYDWTDDKREGLVRPEQHLAEVEGPLMAWWPAPVEMLEYEWTERFYE